MAAEEDSVKVCVRIRPTITREQGDQVTFHWKAENATISQIDGTRSFSFDRVFNSHETTSQVYQEVAVPIIRSALQGYNGTIFAYGQTSSGKTYTMMGTPSSLGIIPQAVQEVFKIIQEIPNREFLLRVSYMEIYNETVTDLLCDGRRKKPLDIREDVNRNVYVSDLTEELVMVPEHVMQWIKKGEKNRHYGETKMNEHSSRSHTIFRMIVESRERNDPGNSENCDGAVMVSHLNLVDLAGSERASQTGAEGVRLKEGCNINRSLFILGQVIKKLSDDQPGLFINYRDSKLTRILQNSLGGNTKTVIICTITPVSFDETLSTLQFASAAKNVKNKPHVNEVLDDEALLKRYRKEIMDLKKQLEDLEASSETKTHAMAKEEHSQLLAEIQQLQKEREDRIWHLTNIVVASTEVANEDQRVKRKRRVTWAPGKLQNSLYSAGVPAFDAGSRLGVSFSKKPKMCELSTLHEIDDSICTEFSDFDEASRVFEDLEPDWNLGSKVTRREKSTLSQSMIDIAADPIFSIGALAKTSSSQKSEEMAQKLAELENKLKSVTRDYEAEVEKRQLSEKEALRLQQQLQAKEEENNTAVTTFEREIASLKDKLQTRPEADEAGFGAPDEHGAAAVPDALNKSNQTIQPDQLEDNAAEGHSSHIHDLCKEQIQMLEQKIMDLEGNNQQSDFMESLQICEALMQEKDTALNELATLREHFDSVVLENESLKQEMAAMEKYVQEKSETNEFEELEKETQKEHEAQLIHEITSLKKLVENAEMYNQELEADLEKKSNLLKEHEKQIAELKKEAEILMKKVRYSDIAESLQGDGEKLCEEVLQLKQSLADAETVTRDAQREAAFLRSENLELREKMDMLAIRSEQREKDASSSEKQLETEKSNYKKMQSDLQKELQCAFNEINQLNGLLVGRVPKDLLSRVELDQKVADYSKQLANILEEKSALEKEVSHLSEYKTLPHEIELLKDQVGKASADLSRLQNEKENSDNIIREQNHKIEERDEQLDRLKEEMEAMQAKLHQIQEQYSELKSMNEDLQERCSLADEELKKKDTEAQSLVEEITDLKLSLEMVEEKLSSAQLEKGELIQNHQDLASQVANMQELLKTAESDRDGLQDNVSHMTSLIEALQQQANGQSDLLNVKQQLEQANLELTAEIQQLKEQLDRMQSSPDIPLPEDNLEASMKLQELQVEMRLLVQQRDELQSKFDDLLTEKNTLQQDLNDNIEMSIETQDELRTTLEELKHQKQLVATLEKQITDYAERISKGLVQDNSEFSFMQLQASEAKCEALTEEKVQLETNYQSVISENESLKESVRSAEQTVAQIEDAKNNVLQKLDSVEEELQSVSRQRDELESVRQNLQVEKEDLRDEVERAKKQLEELNVQQQLAERSLPEDVTKQLQDQIHEKERLLEMLKSLTEERDQLKLDLQENIELSVETQEELRNALDELKNKSQLLDTLRSQTNGPDESRDIVGKDLENKVLHLEKQLHATVTERDRLIEELRVITEELKHLQDLLSTKRHCIPKNDQEVQVFQEMSVDEINEKAGMEEAKKERELIEKIDDLQQQLLSISQEKVEYENCIDSLKKENLQLTDNLQSYTENAAVRSREAEELMTEIEALRMQAANTNQLLKLKEQEILAIAEKLKEASQCNHTTEIKLLEESLQQSNLLLETLQREKLELSQKLSGLQEEFDNLTLCREDLLAKLEMAESENASLKERIETALQSTTVLQEPSLKETIKHEEDEHKIEEGHVTCEMEDPSKDEMEVAQKSTLNENPQTEEQLCDLQQQLSLLVQERDDLKLTRERLTAEIDNLQMHLKENDDMILHLKHELQETTEGQREEFEQAQLSLKTELNQIMGTLTTTEAALETLRTDKVETEQRLLHLQQEMEVVMQELDDVKASQQNLILEREQLREDLQKNADMKNPAANHLEENEQLLKNLKDLTSQLSHVENEKVLSEEKLSSLQIHMEAVIQEKEELQITLQSLQAERDQLKDDLRENVEMSVETQDDLRRTQEELHQQRERINELTNEISTLEQKMKPAANLQNHIEGIASPEKPDLTEAEQLLKDLTSQLSHVENEKILSEEKLSSLQIHMEAVIQEKGELQISLQSLQAERDQLKEDLQENVEMSIETQDELRRTQEELHQQRERINELTKEISSLEQKIKPVENHLEETASPEQPVATETEQLLKNLKDLTSQLSHVENEKVLSEEKLSRLQNRMEAVIQEKEELQITLQSLQAERDQLKDDLQENVEMSIETQDDLRRTQDELYQQRERINELTNEMSSLEQKSIETQDDLRRTQAELNQQSERISELTNEISSLEQKVSSLEGELCTTCILLKEATAERDALDQSKQKQTQELEQLVQDLSRAEAEKAEALQTISELTLKLTATVEKIDQISCSTKSAENEFSLLQNELQETVSLLKEAIEEKEILYQKNQKLSSQIEELSETLKSKEASLELTANETGESAQRIRQLTEDLKNVSQERDQLQILRENLEQEISSLQTQLQENINLVNGAIEDKEFLNQDKQKLLSEIEELTDTLKNKEASLMLLTNEKAESDQRMLQLTEDLRQESQEREQLQNIKEKLENEVENLQGDMKQLQHECEALRVQESQKSCRLEELLLELEQLKKTTDLKEATAQELEAVKAALQKQVQQHDVEVASLRQELEQFQQLLQRARSEKETIYTSLQDQEKANEQLKESLSACDTELGTAKKQRDEISDHLSEKVKDVNDLLEQISSLQQRMLQVNQELNDEQSKNLDLSEKVDQLETEIQILHLKHSEPTEEDGNEVEECTQTLQDKNHEMQDLILNISTVFNDQHSLLNTLSLELQAEMEAEKQLTSIIKDSLSSTNFKVFESLQTESNKLNTQLLSLLNRFKVLFKNSPVKEEQYDLVTHLESELCIIQKKNDELQIQCQNFEENGTKWTEDTAERLKFCELECLNTLIFQKIDFMQCVKGGFSVMQVSLNGVENNLKEQVKSKKQFLSWLEEFKGSNIDAKKLHEGFHNENKRIASAGHYLYNKLKEITQSKIKQDTTTYLHKLESDLQQKKELNTELVQKMHKMAPAGDSNILEEENVQLREKLKHLQAELKKTESRIKSLENEMAFIKADAKRKEEKAALLQERLLSSVKEAELAELKAKICEKEKQLEAALNKTKALQEEVAKGAAPFREEIDNLKNQVVKVEMDRMKLSKSTDQQIASLKSAVEYKEECLRKLKEQLRRSQKEADSTICSEKDESSYPMTCGGGSGIVQSTAMLMLQSENASLKREFSLYKKKYHQLSRIVSTQDTELKKLKHRSMETPRLFTTLHEPDTSSQSQSSSDELIKAPTSPRKPSELAAGMQRKHGMSPSKGQLPKHQVLSPNKAVRHSVPAASPVKAELERKRALSPYKPKGQLFSDLTLSPCKKKSALESASSISEKVVDDRAKSLPYCPTKFFDNSMLGTLPEPKVDASEATNHSADANPPSQFSMLRSDLDLHTGPDTEASEVNWWDRPNKNKDVNECKAS